MKINSFSFDNCFVLRCVKFVGYMGRVQRAKTGGKFEFGILWDGEELFVNSLNNPEA